MTSRKPFLFLALLAGLTAAGCASSPTSANTVSRSETGQAMRVKKGEVVYLRTVVIEGESKGGGALVGGALGYAAGNTFSRGRRHASLIRTASAVGGAAVGSAAERRATTVEGLEITVELERGGLMVVVQAADEEFRVGDFVRILERPDGAVRVVQ